MAWLGDAVANESKLGKKTQLKLCLNLANEKTGDYAVPYETLEGETDLFSGLDINKDGHTDLVLRSRGYGDVKMQTLLVRLTNGSVYDREFLPFIIIFYKNRPLLIERHHAVYVLEGDSVKHVCNLSQK